MLAQQKQEIAALFEAALAPIVAGTGLTPTVVLERPRDPSHGDIVVSTNVPADCDPGTLPTQINVYIDPSGVVTDQYGPNSLAGQ